VRAYTALLQGCAWIAGIVIGLMAVAVTFDVLSRNLGWGNTGWVVELSEYSLPVATLLHGSCGATSMCAWTRC
jgi:TRAP-type C4-dicarboxylate transport system permease small subunit